MDYEYSYVKTYFETLDAEAGREISSTSGYLMGRALQPMNSTQLQALYQQGLDERHLAINKKKKIERCQQIAALVTLVYGIIGVTFCSKINTDGGTNPPVNPAMCATGSVALISGATFFLVDFCVKSYDPSDVPLRELSDVVAYSKKNPLKTNTLQQWYSDFRVFAMSAQVVQFDGQQPLTAEGREALYLQADKDTLLNDLTFNEKYKNWVKNRLPESFKSMDNRKIREVANNLTLHRLYTKENKLIKAIGNPLQPNLITSKLKEMAILKTGEMRTEATKHGNPDDAQLYAIGINDDEALLKYKQELTHELADVQQQSRDLLQQN